MDSKILGFVNWGVLVVITLLAVWMVWGSFSGGLNGDVETDKPVESCVDIGRLEFFEYEACYDAYSERIFLKASREKKNYDVRGLDVHFVDLSSQSFSLKDVPGAGETRAYKLDAKKNPGNIDVKLDVVRNFEGSVCAGVSVPVSYCPSGTGGGEGVGVSISPIDGIEIKDFIEVVDVSDADSDIVFVDLVDKEKIWSSTCKSNWDCEVWESCVDGVRRRYCKDLANCAIPTDSPVRAERCDGTCEENWNCQWKECKDGFSVPECVDNNKCGTTYNIPKKLPCSGSSNCVPNVVCGKWSECEVDYDFIDLVGADQVAQLDGGKSRVCVDKSGCAATFKEEVSCSMSVDIYTKRFQRCGEEYIGVYNVLDDSVLAILREGIKNKAALNIYFDDESSVYCDYCFDGSMNGDETGVDCGGSCKSCSLLVYSEDRWWNFLF